LLFMRPFDCDGIGLSDEQSARVIFIYFPLSIDVAASAVTGSGMRTYGINLETPSYLVTLYNASHLIAGYLPPRVETFSTSFDSVCSETLNSRLLANLILVVIFISSFVAFFVIICIVALNLQ
ncbi:hypothetical protein PFISCL1PPCAC_2839, partial [Pristionchus fissidentatus]